MKISPIMDQMAHFQTKFSSKKPIAHLKEYPNPTPRVTSWPGASSFVPTMALSALPRAPGQPKPWPFQPLIESPAGAGRGTPATRDSLCLLHVLYTNGVSQVSGSSQKGNGCLWLARQNSVHSKDPFVPKENNLSEMQIAKISLVELVLCQNLPKWCENMPKTYDVRITTLDAELEFSVEVSLLNFDVCLRFSLLCSLLKLLLGQ